MRGTWKDERDFYPRKFDAESEDDRESGSDDESGKKGDRICDKWGAGGDSRSQQIEGKPLVLLQRNCRSILNKVLELWNLVDTYNADVIIIGTEWWLREKINSTGVFRDDYTTCRKGKCTRGVECSFVLKAISIEWNYGRMRIFSE